MNISEKLTFITNDYNAQATCLEWLTRKSIDEACDTLDILYACVEHKAEDIEYWAVCFFLDDLMALLSGETTESISPDVASEILAYMRAYPVLPCSDILAT